MDGLDRAAMATVQCAWCLAEPGKPCTNVRGDLDWVHVARIREWRSGNPEAH